MADVSTKAIADNDIKNNSFVVNSMADGSYDSKQRGINEFIGSGELDVKYTNRFDDITYYTS